MESREAYAIGIDVGGTNTDSVLINLQTREILSANKSGTTKDISSGIYRAIENILRDKDK